MSVRPRDDRSGLIGSEENLFGMADRDDAAVDVDIEGPEGIISDQFFQLRGPHARYCIVERSGRKGEAVTSRYMS